MVRKTKRMVMVAMLLSEDDAAGVCATMKGERVWSAPVDPTQFEQIEHARRIGTQAGIALYQAVRDNPVSRKR